MKVDGYKVICRGVRYKNGNGHRALKRECEDCTLYGRGKYPIEKPTWRANGFMSEKSRKCKIKELYGKENINE